MLIGYIQQLVQGGSLLNRPLLPFRGPVTKLTTANNLTLVVSILWSFYHACLFAAPVYWALVFNPTRSKFALGLGSYVLWFLAWACMALVAIACIGLGTADRSHFKVSPGTCCTEPL